MENARDVDRMGQVTEEENQLHQCCDGLNNRIEVLEEKLHSILGSDDPKVAPVEPPEEQLVPLADSIRGARKSVSRSIARINSVIRRIEL